VSLRIAVLGQGSAGRRHAEDLAALGCEVVVYDPEREAVAGRRADSAEAAVGATDAVVVASPTSLHPEQALLAIDRGRPVLVEKPLAAEVADAERIAARAQAAGLVSSGVAMNLRFHAGVLGLRELIDSGSLGHVLYAAASFGFDLRRWRPTEDYRQTYSARAELGGGIVLDAIHELDLVLWLLGPVASVAAETARTDVLDADVEHIAASVLRLRSGALVVVDVNFVEASYRRGILVAGTNATATWDWGAGHVVVRDASGGERRLPAGHDVRDTYRAEIADFVEAVAVGRRPRTTLSEGADAVRLAQAVKRSARDGERVRLPERSELT
jgi:predicted dehydrogenase